WHALDVKIADLDCPRPCRDVLAVAFPAGGRPVVITGKAQNDIAYECTIAVWAFSIATGSVATGPPGSPEPALPARATDPDLPSRQSARLPAMVAALVAAAHNGQHDPVDRR